MCVLLFSPCQDNFSYVLNEILKKRRKRRSLGSGDDSGLKVAGTEVRHKYASGDYEPKRRLELLRAFNWDHI